MFPQLIAGPIVRYRDIAQQLDYARMSFSQFSYGVETFLIGLSKKVLFANTAGMLYESISVIPMNEITVLLLWISKIAFAFQIYFDFCGYSDMAIGLGGNVRISNYLKILIIHIYQKVLRNFGKDGI